MKTNQRTKQRWVLNAGRDKQLLFCSSPYSSSCLAFEGWFLQPANGFQASQWKSQPHSIIALCTCNQERSPYSKVVQDNDDLMLPSSYFFPLGLSLVLLSRSMHVSKHLIIFSAVVLPSWLSTTSRARITEVNMSFFSSQTRFLGWKDCIFKPCTTYAWKSFTDFLWASHSGRKTLDAEVTIHAFNTLFKTKHYKSFCNLQKIRAIT